MAPHFGGGGSCTIPEDHPDPTVGNHLKMGCSAPKFDGVSSFFLTSIAMLAFPIPHFQRCPENYFKIIWHHQILLFPFQRTYLVMPCHQNSYASFWNLFIPDPDGLRADTSQVEISGDQYRSIMLCPEKKTTGTSLKSTLW